MRAAIAPHAPITLRELVRRHPVAVYFAAAFALSWADWIPLALSGARVDFGSDATHVPGLFGPAVAALLVTAAADGRKGVVKLLASCVTFGGSWRPIALAILGPLALFAAAAAFAGLPPLADLGVFGGLPEAGVLPLWAMLLLAAFGEETGWRGFALPRLQQHRSALSATVLLTFGWAAWHAPAFFVLAGYSEMGAAGTAGFFLALLGGSFVLTWLYNGTGGSVLVVALWHASFNLVTGTRAGRGPIAAMVSIAVMIAGFALAAADLRARRKGAPPVLG
ncbi:MAG: CPBP family intramembrane glutamic endopeptidase [Myxococcales bacterium]